MFVALHSQPFLRMTHQTALSATATVTSVFHVSRLTCHLVEFREHWVGSYEGRYQTHRRGTRFELSCQISPSTGKLEITGSGRDFTGNFRFEGAATSPTEIAMTKLIGPANNRWHKATVDLDKREMRGNWGGAWYPNKVDGSLVFQRQMTQEEIQQEAEAARRAADEAKLKQEEEEEGEEAAAAARKKQEEEAAAAAARQKREEEEEVAKKKQQNVEEAARKQRESSEKNLKRQRRPRRRNKNRRSEQERSGRMPRRQDRKSREMPCKSGKVQNNSYPDSHQRRKLRTQPLENLLSRSRILMTVSLAT
jgi:hypothetical protein